VHGIPAADYAASLRMVYYLKKIVVAEQRSDSEIRLHKLLAYDSHADFLVVHHAFGLAEDGGELRRRHDSKIGEHQLAHVLVDIHDAPVVAHGQHSLQIMEIQLLAVRLNNNGAAAYLNHVAVSAGGLKHFRR